jgi:RuvB-like protein 1 (pontin 52)
MQIVAIRAHTEGITLEEAALAHLSTVAEKTSLRFAMQLLTPARILATEAYGRDTIALSDLQEVGELFLDAKQSAKTLEANKDKYLY